jgi:hypothetical protein
MIERPEAHRILTEHFPRRDPRWLWLRWRCDCCPERYPCLLRRGALAELAAGIPEPAAGSRWRRLRNHPQWTVTNGSSR